MKSLIFGYGHAGRAYAKAINFGFPSSSVHVIDPGIVETRCSEHKLITSPKDGKYDLVVVATPPGSHFEVIDSLRNSYDNIVVEKPLAIEKNECKKILNWATRGNLYFSVHSMFGSELDLIKISGGDLQAYGADIVHLFCDPYGSSKSHLGGPFWDSIYNILGIFTRLIKDALVLQQVEIIEDSDEVFWARLVYRQAESAHPVRQSIIVRWDLPLNHKLTQVKIGTNSLTYNHSQQAVTDDRLHRTESISFNIPRLTSHYVKVLQDAMLKPSARTRNLQITKRLNQLVWAIAEHR